MAFHVSKTSILSTLDYIEDGRQDIYKWSETRRSKRKGIKGKLYQFKKLFIDKTVLKSFVQNLTVIILLQMVLAALATFICQKFGLDFDVHMSIFVSPIVFPLAFSINADFQRRERVLEDLAQFKGALVVLFFCHRDWLQASGLPNDFLKTVNTKLRGLVLNIKEYLLTEKVVRRNYILTVIYEDLSDISQLNDRMRSSTLPHNSPLITRLIHYHNLMCHSFEQLRVIREYRSPRTIRSFTKVFIFLMPIVLSPYYVHMGIKSGNTWSPYYIAVLTSFIFGTLQGVQDVLDDPFDGISEDDINLGQLEDWTAHSLLTNRVITVGRFTVTTKAKDTGQLDSSSESDNDHSPKPKVIQPVKVHHKRKPILRKVSFRRVDHGEENPDEEHRKKSLYPETAHRLEDLARRGLTGSTTILPGMKLKRSNSDSLTDGNSHSSLAEFFKTQGVNSSGRDSHDSKKVWFSDGHKDSDQDNGVFVSSLPCSLPSDYTRTEWMLDEDTPLIALDSRSGSPHSTGTGTSSLDTTEIEPPKGLPEKLYEGTNLVSGRFSVNKEKDDPPASLANLFGGQPERTLDETDGPSTSQSSQPQAAAVPSSFKNVFGRLQNQHKGLPSTSGVLSPPGKTPRPRVLHISPLARTDSPPMSGVQFQNLPVAQTSRSAPTTPEQEKRWNTPITPSPEDAVSIPLKSVTRQQSADFPLRKKSADKKFAVDKTAQTSQDSSESAPVPSLPQQRKKSPDTSSGNPRFEVKSSAQTPDVETTSRDQVSPSERKKSSGNSRFSVNPPAKAPGENHATQAARENNMEPNSRFNVAKLSDDVTSPQREDQPLVTSGVPNYGVNDLSPSPSILTTPPSRFQVNNTRTISEDTERPPVDADADADADVVAARRDSFALLSLDGESTEVYI